MYSVREVIEAFIRKLQADVTPQAVLINKNDLFETTDIPSLLIQGPEVTENKERRTDAKEFKKDTDALTYEQRNYPRFYHFDFDFILTTGSETDLLDLQEKILKFFMNNPELAINEDDKIVLLELTPMGGLSRPNLSNLRQASGKYRIEDVLIYDDSLGGYTHAAFNSSYSALYYPWLQISDPVTGKKKLVPPSGAVAGCYARSDRKTYVWYAPAGIDRGRIFNVLALEYNTSRGERDVLYPEGINVIASFPDTGINIWGQRTLQSQPSATDRVNVRRLMMYIEEAVAESSRFVVFEPNNPQTWRALIRLINPFLQDIRDKGGLYDYRVQCDEETNTPAVIDRNELITRIFVKPTKTAEFVELNFVLTSTGTNFDEIFGA